VAVRQQDLWDDLCGDGAQPWPAEALYEVEGLNYLEALKVLKMHQDGEELPSYARLREIIAVREAEGWDLAKSKDKLEASKAIPLLIRAGRRRAMAASLGVTDPREQAALSREAGAALDRVAVAAKKASVQLDLSRRGSRRELLETSRLFLASLVSARGPAEGAVEGEIEHSVSLAARLISAVDEAARKTRKVDYE